MNIVNDIVNTSNGLKSFIGVLSKDLLDLMDSPNALRTITDLDTAISNMVEKNVDALILSMRYYKTISSSFRDDLADSLIGDIVIENVTSIELINYGKLSDSNKVIFEMIYIMAITNTIRETSIRGRAKNAIPNVI